MKKQQSLKALKKKCWSLTSELVRRLDADEGGTTRCYTCSKAIHWKTEAQAGHAIGGRHNAVLLDLEILRPQCVPCNVFKRGNYPIFTTKLIKENGMEWWEAKLEASRRIVKYTRPDLEALILVLKTKLAILDNLCRGCEDKNCRINGCMGA